eukprot:m.95643 g.95643  ORF g.95643 m.95643 type:complete len:300 (+) comp8955_c0_seq2:47-946(+)
MRFITSAATVLVRRAAFQPSALLPSSSICSVRSFSTCSSSASVSLLAGGLGCVRMPSLVYSSLMRVLSLRCTPTIRVATVLERYPRSKAPLTETEQKWFEFEKQIRVEKSALSFEEFERLRLAQETTKKPKKSKKSKRASANENNSVSATGAASLDDSKRGGEDSRQLSFTPGSHVTEDDKEGNIKSLNRNLSGKLYFVVKETKESNWSFPTLERYITPDVTLRETAEAALEQAIPLHDVNHYFLSNAPSFHTTDDTFYFRCIYINGKHTPSEKYADFAWLTKEEIKELVGVDDASFIA